ncbi:uncharacterized protein I206_106963 [Kwoniella pini CBS 10737]|uniref:Uncharacterized protein n=1 Tax=Kwoniella pini CBS 10737 TaxID=1296096 RepID=A0A1B9HZM2_9TREE|nr:uncharacterized protein I206_05495 [Kwoniella pini CBS 10737]OCF48714.1 hypothetical protein I206_05495 [Kwoniella pini CBS 10737]
MSHLNPYSNSQELKNLSNSSIPTSLSLSIPFFSRSSSSSNTTSTDLETCYSNSFSDNSTPDIGIVLNLQPNLNFQQQHNLQICSSKELEKSISINSIRPKIKKMPSWNNQTWSPRNSNEFIRHPSSSSSSQVKDSNFFLQDDNEEEDILRFERRKSLIKLKDFVTWGNSKKSKLPINTKLKIKEKEGKSNIITKLKIKRGSTSSLTETKTIRDEEIGKSLQRVWARTIFGVDNERERRGSDWPPTQSRELTLDLSCIPTFTGEQQMKVDVNHIKENFEKFKFGQDELTSSSYKSQETLTLKEGVLYHDPLVILSEQRVDTPLELPLLPKMNIRKSYPSILSPVLDEYEEGKEEHLAQNDLVSMNGQIETTPEKTKQYHGASDEIRGNNELNDDEGREEEFFTPSYRPSSILINTAFPNKSESPSKSSKAKSMIVIAPDETPQLDLTIFSPRPKSMILPRAPLLRGLNLLDDSLPISPLELPSISSTSFSSFQPINLSQEPNSRLIESSSKTVLSKDLLNSPRLAIVMPIPKKGIPNQTIESVLGNFDSTLSRHKSLNERRPSRPITSNRNFSLSLSNSNSTEFKPTTTSRRRMSLIIKPSILPCPTPPSLLTSPKSINTEQIPPLFSPCSISPTNQIHFASSSSISGLPIRRGRGSLKLKLPQSYFPQEAETSCEAVINSESEGKLQEPKEHIPTPGTFGLEGEKNRLETSNINPYFA